MVGRWTGEHATDRPQSNTAADQPTEHIIGSESRADKRRNSRDGANKERSEGRPTQEHATTGPASHATTTTNPDTYKSGAVTAAAPDTRETATDGHGVGGGSGRGTLTLVEKTCVTDTAYNSAAQPSEEQRRC